MAGLHFVQTGDNSQLIASLKQSQKAFDGLNDAAKQSGVGIDEVMGKLKGFASLAGVSFGAAGLTSFAKKIYDVRASMQDLESTMKVFLGSEEKAVKFTKQLQDYAYWNMFEFTDLTEASTQLMAYGTATEDLIGVIDQLSNVATGTKKPLEQYINLYNKAKSTGRVDSNGLLQWASAGIVLKDELQKMNETVNGSTITFEQLQKVLNHVTSDGEKFGGLMMSQMDNLSASWGQLEDNFSNMLNELGEKLQGTFKSGIDIAGSLVDNYEKIGKALATLILMYGEYKAVLIATRAIQSATVLVENIRLIGMFRNELGLLKAAQQAFNITAMKNPYIALATVLITTVTAIVGLTKAFSDSRTEVEKLNDAYDDRVRALEDEQRLANEQIRTLKDETASTEALAVARIKLSKSPAFEGMSSGEIAAKSVEDLQKILKEYYANQKEQTAKDQIQGLEDNIEKNANLYSSNKSFVSKPTTGFGYDPRAVSAAVEAMNNQETAIKDAQKELTGIDITKITLSTKDLNEQAKQLEKNVEQQESYIATYEKSIAMLSQNNKRTKEEETQLRQQEVLLIRAKVALEQYGDALRIVNNKINNANNDPNNKGDTLAGIVIAIEKKEKAVQRAQNAYAANTSENNKQLLETEISALNGLTEVYENATGRKWVVTKSVNEKILSDTQKLANEQENIEIGQLNDQRQRIIEEGELQKKQIDQEYKQWRKENNGRTNSTFATRKQQVDLQTRIKLEEADKQLAKWRKDTEDNKINLQATIDESNLKTQLDRATSFAEQQAITQKIRKQEDNRAKRENKKNTTNEMLGVVDDTATISKVQALWKSTGGDIQKVSADELSAMKLNAQTLQQLFDIQQKWQDIAALEQQQRNAARDAEDYNTRLDRFTSYLDQTITLEEQYQKRLADIRAQYGLAEDADLSQYGDNTAIGRDVTAAKVERDRAQAIVNRDTNIGGEDTKWVEDLANLGADVAGKAMEEVRAIYDQFIKKVEQQIQSTTQARDTAQANITAEQDFQATAEQQLTDVNTQLNADGLTEDQKNELLRERTILEQQIAESKERQAIFDQQLTSTQQNLNQLTQVRAKAESAAANATDSASTKSQKKMQATRRTTTALADSFAAVKESADAIADTFGGVLSQKAKKALGTMSDVASFGEQTINSIASLTQGTMKGMSMSAFMASESISTVEKASVILTIISMAVQAVMAIVKIASQFTESAKMQEAIDEQTEKVDNLKRRHQELEREYKDKSGTEYYKGLAKSAKDYDNIIAEQEKAVQEANALYERQKNKYGEDSDKAKDAKEQLDDLKDDENDLIDSQREQYNQLLEDLSGTNLKSFSESLADALIDGFAQGKEGISDVWEDTMDDLMRTMMKQQLALAIQDMFDPVFKELNEKTKNGDLTQSEIDYIMSEFDAQSEKAKYLAEKYYDLMSERGLLDDADAEGSQGFGQMTQDTADALNARFTALQIEGANVVEAAQTLVTAVAELGADSKLQVSSLQTLMYNSGIALQVAQEQLDQLQVIADNTALLADTNDRLKAIQQNTSKL